MKIFITGPSETPYAYGLFEFNAYFPQTYPQTAPNLKFLTTNNGRVRFNPNLYDTGYVCLSLLDTWSGSAEQRWQAGKSTLMQVLVSVQSIVLVDKPYFNEPGFDVGRSGGIHSASESYNRRVELDTVRHAILEPLKHPPQYAGFDKVIRAHFYLVQERIKKQVRVWADKATKDSQQKVQEWEQLVKEVDKELAKLKPPST
ncbi:ubiquitin-conjugating enzyme/RWD-like protein [Chytriomyces cf. hyalinus JEL632]|nr:ubiquitin-conjugating enzyme/RWD-like protein [Chytriomyces cf. hyalinus JEL632]